MESQTFSTPPPSSFPPPDAPGDSSNVTPSGVWYVVGGALAGAGIVACVVMLIASFSQYRDAIDNLDRINVPGEATIEFDDAGEHWVYYEPRDDTFLTPDVAVEITGPTGTEIAIVPDVGVGYISGGRDARTLYSFELPEPGAYEFVVSYEESNRFERGNIAVGRGPSYGSVFGRAVLGIAVGFVGVVAGIVISIVVGIKRGRNKRRLAPRTPPPPPPGWGYPPPGAMPPVG